MTTILAFFAILSVVVLVHEWGHFIAARRSGVAVEEFGFGFPPRMLGWKRRATIYSINWIPFGGFVRLKGEGAADREALDAFPRKPAWKRLFILGSGVGMNYLLTALLLSIAFAVGVTVPAEEIREGATIRDRRVHVVQVAEDSPATRAGIQPRDRIVAVDGKPIATINELQEAQRGKQGQSVRLTIRRGEQTMENTVIPEILAEGEDAKIGVHLTESAVISYSPFRAFLLGVQSTVVYTWQIITSLVDVLKTLVVSGTVKSDIVGPVGIAVLTGQVAQLGLASLIQFTALLSLSLAVMNFTPFPALDGGRALFILVEKIRGRALNASTENLIHNTGFYVLLLLILLISIRDVSTFGLVDAVKRLFS